MADSPSGDNSHAKIQTNHPSARSRRSIDDPGWLPANGWARTPLISQRRQVSEHSNSTMTEPAENTVVLVGVVFGVFIVFLFLVFLLKWLSRIVQARDERYPNNELRLDWGSLFGQQGAPSQEPARRGSTVYVPYRRTSHVSEQSATDADGLLVPRRPGRRDSADSANRSVLASRSNDIGAWTPMYPPKTNFVDYLPVEVVREPVARQQLKREYVSSMILKRRGQMMVLSNLARSLGKSQTAGIIAEGDAPPEFQSLAKQLTAKSGAMDDTRATMLELRGQDGVRGEPLAASKPSDAHEYYAFSVILLLSISFLLLGRNVNLLAGPEYSNSDHGLNTVMLIVSLVLATEFSYNVLYKSAFLGSFFFWMDLLVMVTTVPDIVLFFDGRAFDHWNDDGPWPQTSVRGGALAVGVRYFADVVRVFKIYSLLNRSWAIMKFFRPRRETMIGRLVSLGIKQKVAAIVLSLMLVQIFLTILSRTYDLWPKQSWDDELRRMQLLLALAGNVPSEEPFLSFATRWIAHVNCEGQVQLGQLEAKQGFHVVELDRRSHAQCYVRDSCRWPAAAGIAAQEHTSGCRLRYLRVSGVDVWGEGPSGLTWMQDLRAYPSERIVSYLEPADEVALCPHLTLSSGRGVLAEALEYGTVADTSDPIDGDPCTMLVVEARMGAEQQALKSVLTVIVLVVLLATSNYFFNDLGRRLIVEPLLEMVDLVQAFSVNPMAEVDQRSFAGVSSDTKYIGQALFKLSNLLQVAYGEVGSHVIQHNLESERAINAMVPGSRQNMIIGFCDIRSFTTCTEGLQDEVMVYVNKIADYIHVAVSDNDGHPNKNIGDAFQVAWQIPKRYGQGMGRSRRRGKYVGDSALRSFIRIIVETTSCPKLLHLTCRDEVQSRIPGYTTRMGFGLHAGWAIQGAVGSEHKIDLAWLSPHVQWAERLEFATKLYKVKILMSDAFREHLSPKVQRLCRRVDRVKVPDTPVPLDLYTYDVRSFDLEDWSWPTADLKGGNSFFSQFPPAHRREWSDAFQAAVSWYIEGDWQKATKTLMLCQMEVSDDGPTERLLAFMKAMGGEDMVCPQAWKGYRETTEF